MLILGIAAAQPRSQLWPDTGGNTRLNLFPWQPKLQSIIPRMPIQRWKGVPTWDLCDCWSLPLSPCSLAEQRSGLKWREREREREGGCYPRLLCWGAPPPLSCHSKISDSPCLRLCLTVTARPPPPNTSPSLQQRGHSTGRRTEDFSH